ncbi:Plasmodium variant antigen protein Cir/Yir/Bir, putative, partial [Plasmodium berghei]
YCPNGDSGNTKECKTDLDKINAACLWLFQQNIIINIDSLSKEKSEAFIIYIMIWLSYMLNLKNVNNIKSLKDFYTNHIKNNTHYTTCNKSDNYCSNSLKNKTGYNNFKEFIKRNECFMSINITDMSNFYVDCSDIPSLSPINTTQNPVQSSEPSSKVTSSSSSIKNKLILVLSILVAIPICLGISYKYSLFGFRKKCKKIKKKINIRLEDFYAAGQG